MFNWRNREQSEDANNKWNRMHLRNIAIELHKICLELGCSNCYYNDYDGKGHCKLSSFDKANVEYRPRDWAWIETE